MIDATHWEKLRGLEPHEAARRAGAEYDERSGEFALRILTDELRISAGKRAVAWADSASRGGKPPGFHYWLVSVVCLVSARDRTPAQRWAAPSSLPYGEFFFRGPHALPTEAVAAAFGDQPERFAEAARRLGGRAWLSAQNAFVMPALPKVPILAQFWPRDEEFPSRASFLFDASAWDNLAIDAHLSLAIIVANRLADAARAG